MLHVQDGEQQQSAAKSKESSKKPSSKASSAKDDPRRYPSKDRIGGLGTHPAEAAAASAAVDMTNLTDPVLLHHHANEPASDLR